MVIMKRLTFQASLIMTGASVAVLALSCVGADDRIENRSAALTTAQQ
jgi:hypothetical protein